MPNGQIPQKTPSECPVCGADVPAKARACPGCGADERTGWNTEHTRYDGLDLPDGAFEDDETLKEEGLKPRSVPRGIPVFWRIVGLVLAAILIYFTMGAVFWRQGG
jgi:hypothetical protein